MKIVAYLLFLWFGCRAQLAQAQHSDSLKAAVYSAFLTWNFATVDAAQQRPDTSVVVIPSEDYAKFGFLKHGFLADLSQRRATWAAKVRQQRAAPSERATLDARSAATRPDTAVVAAWRHLNAFYQWLSADSGRARMTRRLDSLAKVPNAGVGTVRCPGKQVYIESIDFCTPPKWRGWEAFYRRYKRSYGVVALSDVAFTPDARCAAFYVGESQGSLNGVGYLVFMEKTGQGWRVRYTHMLWIS